MLLSVVVPIKDEKENIEPLAKCIVEAIDPVTKEYEIVLVDDGSSDGSLEEMIRVKQDFPHIRILKFTKNNGQTAGLDAGFRNAKGKYVAMLDGDLQTDPKDLPAMMEMLDEFDMVCGIRAKRNDSFVKKISSKVGNGVRNWLTRENIQDTGCPLKIFKRHCFDNIKLFNGMHRFLPTLFRMEGYKVKQVPVTHYPRTKGTSKYGVGNRAFRGFRDVLAVRWMQDRHLKYEIEKEL